MLYPSHCWEPYGTFKQPLSMFPLLLSYILRQQFNLYINNCDYHITVCSGYRAVGDIQVVMFQPNQYESDCSDPVLVRIRLTRTLFQFPSKPF